MVRPTCTIKPTNSTERNAQRIVDRGNAGSPMSRSHSPYLLMALEPRKILRLPIMWAITNPMNRIPLMATRTFLPTVVRRAAGSLAVPVANAVAVMGRAYCVANFEALSGTVPGNASKFGIGWGRDGAFVAVRDLEVGALEGEVEHEGACVIGRQHLDGADADARVGGDVAFPVPTVLAARPTQVGAGPNALDGNAQVAHHVHVEGHRIAGLVHRVGAVGRDDHGRTGGRQRVVPRLRGPLVVEHRPRHGGVAVGEGELAEPARRPVLQAAQGLDVEADEFGLIRLG